jgi:Gpi18-like mannosyltransferase
MQATKKSIRTIFLIWLAWALLLLGFLKAASMRLQLRVPDTVLDWVAEDTAPGAHARQPYLNEPFLNRQVAYDSEYYISIAIAGYDDSTLFTIWLPPDREPELIWTQSPLPLGFPKDYPSGRPEFIPANYVAYSLNYAFFPFYPLVMRTFGYPLSIFHLNPIATASLAGVLVSLLGALGAMLALYDLTRDKLGEAGALKTAFYLIVFPTGFFLAMVLTEGLFAGLAFGALALLRRRQWLWAGLLAACATLTRAVGVALVIPFGITWFGESFPIIRTWMENGRVDRSWLRQLWSLIWKGFASLTPLLAYQAWNIFLGKQFHAVEAAFFGRGAFLVEESIDAWRWSFLGLFRLSDIHLAYWLVRGMILLTFCLVCKTLAWRRWEARIHKAITLAIDLLLLAFGAVLIYVWDKNTINEQRSFYYMLEFSAVILALVACAYTLRSHAGLALFSLLVVLISFFSGEPQGMPRYILGTPAVFVMLGQLGKDDEVFDRVWTLGSILLLGLFALLFAFNFWVA